MNHPDPSGQAGQGVRTTHGAAQFSLPAPGNWNKNFQRAAGLLQLSLRLNSASRLFVWILLYIKPKDSSVIPYAVSNIIAMIKYLGSDLFSITTWTQSQKLRGFRGRRHPRDAGSESGPLILRSLKLSSQRIKEWIFPNNLLSVWQGCSRNKKNVFTTGEINHTCPKSFADHFENMLARIERDAANYGHLSLLSGTISAFKLC